MCGEVCHELVVDEGIKQLGDDGEEGDWSVEFGELSVFLFEELNDFCGFECIWVAVFVYGLVEESG